MKTFFGLATGMVLMVVMYVYFLAVCLYALVKLPFVKLIDFIKSSSKVNQFAGV